MSEPIITECPGCHSRFRVTEGQLKIARGQVRCGACLQVFDAGTESERLKRELAPIGPVPGAASAPQPDSTSAANAPEAPHTTTVRSNATPATSAEISATRDAASKATAAAALADPLSLSEYRASAQAGPDADDNAGQNESIANPVTRAGIGAATSAPAETPAAASNCLTSADSSPADLSAGSKVAPERELAGDLIPLLYAEPILLDIGEDQTDPVATAGWILASLLALGVLAGQYLWFERASLAHVTELRPLYLLACEHLACGLTRVDLAQLENEQLVVRPHPQFNDALTVDIRLRNLAAFEQPFPALRLVFTDLRGHRVAERLLRPADYLPPATASATPQHMPAGVAQELQLQITDPGPNAVSYELQLLTP